MPCASPRMYRCENSVPTFAIAAMSDALLGAFLLELPCPFTSKDTTSRRTSAASVVTKRVTKPQKGNLIGVSRDFSWRLASVLDTRGRAFVDRPSHQSNRLVSNAVEKGE